MVGGRLRIGEVCGRVSRTAVGRCGRGIGDGLYWRTKSMKDAANAGFEVKISVNSMVASVGVFVAVVCVVVRFVFWSWVAGGMVVVDGLGVNVNSVGRGRVVGEWVRL